MAISALAGVIIGILSLVIAFVLEGGHLGALLEPTAAMIVFGGTIGAVVLSFPSEDLKRLLPMFKIIFTGKTKDLSKHIEYFRDFAIKTRREGLLSIEQDISGDENIDPFIKKGFQMVVDGVDPETVKKVLEGQAYVTFERHKAGLAIFEAAGGFAPTMGIIGTVMGLVHVLGNLDDPKTLGPKIAVAFIATLYGVASANLLWLPMANKLKSLNKNEYKEKEFIIDAILSIQEGVNPNTLVEKLKSYLSKDEENRINTNSERENQ